MLESKVENHLSARVKRAGGEVRKVQWIGRHSAPDRLVLLPDRSPTLAELKRPGKKPTAKQLREHARLISYGFRVVVLDSVEAVENFMEQGK